MIKGVHTMFYSSQPEELRSFLADKLGFTFTDVGHGWLIFDMPDAEMGVHPAGEDPRSVSGTPSISFYCDDIRQTVSELKKRGVEFTREIEDVGYGLNTTFKAPGGFTIDLYQPSYKRNPAAAS